MSSEKEEWISLMHHLEVLTLVSNVIGRDSLATLPHAPYATCDEEGSGVGGEKEIDIRDLLPLHQCECLCSLLVHDGTLGPLTADTFKTGSQKSVFGINVSTLRVSAVVANLYSFDVLPTHANTHTHTHTQLTKKAYVHPHWRTMVQD